MKQEKIDRINELYRKKKEGTLTEEEKAEQAELRAEYIAQIRGNLLSTLEHTSVQEPDGSIRKLHRRNRQREGVWRSKSGMAFQKKTESAGHWKFKGKCAASRGTVRQILYYPTFPFVPKFLQGKSIGGFWKMGNSFFCPALMQTVMLWNFTGYRI